MSPAATSNSCDAMRRPFSIALSQAIADALPAIISERDATDGVPSGTSSLSPSISFTLRDIDAELLRDDARQGREMPLPHRLHAEPDRRLAVASKRRSAFSFRMPPATSRKQHIPMPRSLPFLRDAARRLAKPFQSDERERLVHRGLELAAVVDRTVRRLVRHRLGRNEIAPPQRHAVDPHAGAPRRRSAARSGRSPPAARRRDRARAAPHWSAPSSRRCAIAGMR